MKNFKYSSFFLAFICFFMLQPITSAEEFWHDPGLRDSVLFEGIEYYLDGPPWVTKLKIPAVFFHDEELMAITVPLVWSGPVILDSASYTGSRVEKADVKIANIDSINKKLLLGISMDYDPIPPGRGLFNTLYFSIADTGNLEIDTTIFPPSNILSFTWTSSVSWPPEFVKLQLFVNSSLIGDVNQDGLVNVVDIVSLINYLFRSGPALSCFECADVNGDCVVSVSDVVYFINFLFKDGPPPQLGCAH